MSGVNALRFLCPECGKMVGSYVPEGGDGSCRLLRSHVCKGGVRTALVEAPGWGVRR